MDDESSTLSRSEAVTGLGVLGALMLGLVGVIVFRIVGARPQEPLRIDPALIAAEPADSAAPSSDEGSSTAALDFGAATSESAASPIPISAESGGESVPLASSVEPVSPAAPPALPPSTDQTPASRPVFVAPGSGGVPASK